MKRPVILSFYDYTGVMVKPWAKAGFACYCFDIQHAYGEFKERYKGGGSITYAKANLHSESRLLSIIKKFQHENVEMVFGFPVCTDLAVSGAAHFAKKRAANPAFQIEAANHAINIQTVALLLNAPYMIENPVSVLSTLWRKPDYSFHPFEYGGYLNQRESEHPLYPDYIAPFDAYSKKTCLWTSGNFVMPPKMPVDCESFGASRQHKRLGGKSEKTKNIRSATPRGFAKAVFVHNHMNQTALAAE